MIRHISVFTLEDKKNLSLLKSLLEETAKNCPLIKHSQIGENIAAPPEKDLKGPDFGDLVQIIDFETLEDANAYPTSEAHRYLFCNSPKMKKVTAIDFLFDS